ncbi:MAG: HAD-IA family hydrolase [Chloroflexi bacterium]|nr:HAD-IA family hydrolase [Chloroflexota bacterium]
MIKAVFFDFYGTLGRFFPPREQVQAKALSAFGYTVARDGLVRGYALADEFMGHANAGDQPMNRLQGQARLDFFAQYEQIILREAGVDVDLATARRVWAKVQEQPYGMALYDDAIPTLQVLKERGLILGLLSNIGRESRQLTDTHGLTPYLDFAVTSAEIGSNKPHPPMFLAALERAGVQPQEALHVGDSYVSDVQGARNVGINAVLVDREGVNGNAGDCPKIRGLMEVVDYV